MANINVPMYACQDQEGNLIGLDYASGSYPYVPTTMSGVCFWHTKGDAEEYANHFSSKYKVVRVKFDVIVLD